MKFPKPQPEPSPQQKLAKAQADADHWGAIAANPNLSPEAAEWAFNLARSARAEVALRQKAALWARSQGQGDQMTMLRGLLNPGAPFETAENALKSEGFERSRLQKCGLTAA
jgi:hypothetical protein